jgi:WD40 repeat protein
MQSGKTGGCATCRQQSPGGISPFTLRLWDVASGESTHVLDGHINKVVACAFSLDGRLALSASKDATLRLWDAASGSEAARFDPDAPLLCCAFSPDGRLVIAVDELGSVHGLTVSSIETIPVDHLRAVVQSLLAPSTRSTEVEETDSAPATVGGRRW